MRGIIIKLIKAYKLLLDIANSSMVYVCRGEQNVLKLMRGLAGAIIDDVFIACLHPHYYSEYASFNFATE